MGMHLRIFWSFEVLADECLITQTYGKGERLGELAVNGIDGSGSTQEFLVIRSDKKRHAAGKRGISGVVECEERAATYLTIY